MCLDEKITISCCFIDPRCQDFDIQCAAWADKGECFRNKRFMEKTCAKSCSICLPAGGEFIFYCIYYSIPNQNHWRQWFSELNLELECYN